MAISFHYKRETPPPIEHRLSRYVYCDHSSVDIKEIFECEARTLKQSDQLFKRATGKDYNEYGCVIAVHVHPILKGV